MAKYVLRKTFGAWSAGTEVTLTERHLPNTNSEHIETVLVGGIFGTPIDIPGNLLLRRRRMSMMVPLLNCKARKAIKREALRNG